MKRTNLCFGAANPLTTRRSWTIGYWMPVDYPFASTSPSSFRRRPGPRGHGGVTFDGGLKQNRQADSLSDEPRKPPCVYMLASRSGTLYIGVTSDLARRVWQHKNGFLKGFAKRYAVHRLVWFETHPTMQGAIEREKQMKEWQRSWKIRRIEEMNHDWVDLYEQIL